MSSKTTSLSNALLGGLCMNGELPVSEWAVVTGESLSPSVAALRAADRLNRLQSVSAALAGAATVIQVTEVILDQGTAALEARAAAVALLTEAGDELELVRATGYPSGTTQRISVQAPSMMAEAARTGKPVWLPSLEDLQARYPLFASINATGNAFAALPLLIEGHPIGAVGFSFSVPGERTEEDKAFLRTLAQQCAQAIARARLYDAARMEIAERRRAEETLREREAEIAALNARLHRSVYESSHRIKNHLQALASLVDVQLLEGRQRISADHLRQLSAQIRTIAAIHDTLTADTKTDGTVNALSVKSLLDKVLWMLQQTTGQGVIRFYAEEVTLPVNGGAALAMAVTELVMNAVKHGGAQAEVMFTVEGGQGILCVMDSGPGFATDFDPKAAAHTGLELVASLTRTDLRGHVRYENRAEGGALVTITFPLPAL
ncbi:MAG TPA: GAF domain-containing protein [Chthonomonadaceae bacterium]|nr:GAF domain-containing protein [Chthonomonadaceae bacterium]